CALLCGSLLSPSAWAADTKATVKSGGHFDVDVVKDIPYYTGADAHAAKNKLDLYLPQGHKDFPILFFIHGGPWQRGDKSRYVKLGDRFARNGIGTVIISYRLSPAVKHPEHAKDVARAFAWTHNNIAARGGRADQIFVCGHSAGGHLAALLACDPT